MKKIIMTISIFLVSLFAFNVNAATGTLTVDKNEIKQGEKFTAKVEIKDTAAWNVHLIVNGDVNKDCIVGEINVDNSGTKKPAIINEADVTNDAQNTNKTFKVTCKATKAGELSLTLLGDITNEDAESIDLNTTEIIKVNAAGGSVILKIILVVVAVGVVLCGISFVKKKRK